MQLSSTQTEGSKRNYNIIAVKQAMDKLGLDL